MSEILDRLRTIVRRLELGGIQTSPGTVQQAMRDAAAEIERLRSSPARLAGLREAAEACQRLSRTNRQSSPLTSYVEGRADAGEACAGLILALAGETTGKEDK